MASLTLKAEPLLQHIDPMGEEVHWSKGRGVVTEVVEARFKGQHLIREVAEKSR